MPSLEAGLKRLNYYLIENLETGEDLRVIRWVHSGSDSLVLCLPLEGTPSMINEVTDMLHRAPLTTPTTLSEEAVHDISRALIVLLSDVFALYLKTKNFHWHMSGSHFRDYHLMLDDQSDQIFSMTDAIAERARKLGGTTVRSIGQISRFQRIVDNNAEYVKPLDMIAELRDDNAILTQYMREVHRYVTRQQTWPPQACWRAGLTNLRSEPGSSSSAAGNKRRHR
jgi:starvation-inducible DNA-binding protein